MRALILGYCALLWSLENVKVIVDVSNEDVTSENLDEVTKELNDEVFRIAKERVFEQVKKAIEARK